LEITPRSSFALIETYSVRIGNVSGINLQIGVSSPRKRSIRMDQLTNVLTALSHPTRRAIIGQLAHGPARFLDIAQSFDTALNAVTKHLKLLERAGLIERQRQGREVIISFRGEPLREVAGWVHEYERFWNERLDHFQHYFETKKKEQKR
jgi:DNA-binding transcriptional ArsR family regulator